VLPDWHAALLFADSGSNPPCPWGCCALIADLRRSRRQAVAQRTPHSLSESHLFQRGLSLRWSLESTDREKEIMIKLVSDSSSQTAELRRSELPAKPVVVLVEHCDDVFDRLKHCFTMAGFCVTRARDSTEAMRRYVSKPANLLVVNADMPVESAWLLAAKLQLTHPAARIWAYVCQPSTHDVAAANLLAIEELIAYGGEVAKLESELLDRLGVPANSMPVNKPAPCTSSSAHIDPTGIAAYVLNHS